MKRKIKSTQLQQPVTPAFIIDKPLLQTFLSRLQRSLETYWPNSLIGYSFKTNSLPWLVTYMRANQVWAEVVSDTEYELALALGYTPDEVIFNGPIKGRERLCQSLLEGSIVNLDTKREVLWAAQLARETPEHQFRVGLRINWDVTKYLPEENIAGDQSSRFGFDPHNGDLDRVIQELTSAGVRIAGLHMHRNSRTQSIGVYTAAAQEAANIITTRGLHDLDWIDIGGGFYASEHGSPTFDDYLSTIREVLDPVVDIERTQLIVEPGGSLIAVPVEFHASVVDVKDAGGKRFVVTDASRTNIDPLFQRRRPHDVTVQAQSDMTHTEQILGGFTCVENDRLTVLEGSPELSVGDRIIFHKVGAYTMSLQPLFTEYLPPVYVRDAGGELTLVREKWGVTEYLQGNHWIEHTQPINQVPQPVGF